MTYALTRTRNLALICSQFNYCLAQSHLVPSLPLFHLDFDRRIKCAIPQWGGLINSPLLYSPLTMKPAFLLTLLSGNLIFVYSQDFDFKALLVSPSSNIDPVPANPFGPFVADPQRRQASRTIEGLLVARQVSCQAGWGYCPNLPGRCVTIEGRFALTAKPAMHAQRKDTQSVRTSPIIVAVGLIVLSGDSRLISLFIARGQQCYRDGSNAVRCRNPPPPDPPKQDPPKQDPPPKQDTPKQDAPKQDPPPPSPNPPKQDPTPSTTTTTRISTTTRTPTTTFAASSTTRLVFPTSTEAPAAGYINQVVSLTDPRIAYYGASWVESTSTCFSNIRSRKASGGSHSVQFDFLGTHRSFSGFIC